MVSFSSDKKEIKTSTIKTVGFTDEAAVEDKFGIADYIGGLTRFIEECNTPLTMSIQGTWGTGKTSIMNLVKNELSPDIFPVWFNTWQFSQFNMSEQLPVSLLSSLLSEFKLNDEETYNGTNKAIKALQVGYKYGKTIGLTVVDSVFGGRVADTLESGINKAENAINGNNNDIDCDPALAIKTLKNEFIKCVNKVIEEKKIKRIVIFIDDLDRLNPGKAVELLEVLKLFLDCKNCVFVLAIDYDVVCRGVEIKYGSLADEKMEAAEKGKSFFDKIIQVPFKMPIARYNISGYVKACMDQIGIGFYKNQDVDVYVDLIKRSIGTNPRSMKRLFNAFQLLLKIVPENISKEIQNRQLLFAILCLQHCSDAIYNFMIRNSDILTTELFNALVECEYDSFKEIALKENADIDDLSPIDLTSAKPFLEKLREAIDLNGNKGIEENELNNFIEVMDFTAITSATESETTVTRKEKWLVSNYSELDFGNYNSDQDKEHIANLIKSFGENIMLQLVSPPKSYDCIRGRMTSLKMRTLAYAYGKKSLKGYTIELYAPSNDVFVDETKYPEIAKCLQTLAVRPYKSIPSTVAVSILDENRDFAEKTISELGKLLYELWQENSR